MSLSIMSFWLVIVSLETVQETLLATLLCLFEVLEEMHMTTKTRKYLSSMTAAKTKKM